MDGEGQVSRSMGSGVCGWDGWMGWVDGVHRSGVAEVTMPKDQVVAWSWVALPLGETDDSVMVVPMIHEE